MKAISILTLFFLTVPLAAHEVHYSIVEGKAFIVHAEYDGGEPMSYAECRIFSPEESTIEYQNGRTDKAGTFAFIPATPGTWRILVKDGMGHGFTATMDVSEGSLNTPSIQGGYTLTQKSIMALAVIWGFMGFWFFFRTRRSNAHQ